MIARIKVLGFVRFAQALTNIVGGVQCTVDGEPLEPLAVWRDEDGVISIRRLDGVAGRDGRKFALDPRLFGVRYDDPRITPVMRDVVLDAARRAFGGVN